MQFGFDKVLEMIRTDFGERAYRGALLAVYGGLITFVLYGAGLAWNTTINPLASVIGDIFRQGLGVLNTQDIAAQLLALLSSGLVLGAVLVAAQAIIWLVSMRQMRSTTSLIEQSLSRSIAVRPKDGSEGIVVSANNDERQLSFDKDKGRLRSSLSALRAECFWMRTHIAGLEKVDGIAKHQFVAWFFSWAVSVDVVLQSWDEIAKAQLFINRKRDFPIFQEQVNKLEDGKNAILSWVDGQIERLDNITKELQ